MGYMTIRDTSCYLKSTCTGGTVTYVAMALLENSNTPQKVGLLDFYLWNDINKRWEDDWFSSMFAVKCYPITDHNLKALGYAPFFANCDAPQATWARLTSQYCTSMPYPCPDNLCSGWSAVVNDIEWIPVRIRDTTVPNIPNGLTIIPGDSQLTISWNGVTNTDIFTYHVEVLDGATTIVDGYTFSYERNVIISGLTNGITYTVKVTAISKTDVTGSVATEYGTPTFQCPDLKANMTIN